LSNSTLQQLQAGELTSAFRLSQHQDPITRLQIAENLTELPKEVFDLADCLEVLDLSNNQLTDLPDELETLVNMRILFLSNNHFDQIPAVVSRCPKLEMISFKSNFLTSVAEDVLPIDTRWLILTDNKIEALPDSMGKLHRLQKLALAGNQLTDLPASMEQCKNLELARLSANQLIALPDWLFQLPKLSWLAFSGNEFNRVSNTSNCSVIDVPLADIELGKLLGEGASGLIYRGDWITQPESLIDTDNHIAVKIFKGDVTSDGYPQDELDCCLTAGEQENLIKVIAQLDQTDTDNKLGLVMELIPNTFYNLGLPPSLKTCTRDTFNTGTRFNAEQIIKIAKQMVNAMSHLHAQGISHGDVYAHNMMINDQADMLFGDFGAATNLMTLSKTQREAMERIEVRALGCLLDDLLSLCSDIELKEDKAFLGLIELKDKCMNHVPFDRPRFISIQAAL
jgi:hypothetical protein